MSYAKFKPKFSIITVVFNNENTITDTIRSVAAQTYGEVEYIIVDGKSTDKTLQRITEHRSDITQLVSEPDKGIYDAMNKGIALANGDVIGFINADDMYAHHEVLQKVADAFEQNELDAVYGDLCYVSSEDTASIVRYWRSSPFRRGMFSFGWCPPHPTFFVKKAVYQRYGCFDLDYRIAADVELMMRFLEKYSISAKYIEGVMVKMRMGGTTNKNLANVLKQNREILNALRQHGLPSNLLLFAARKLVSRAKQFITRPAQVAVER
ncbi:glycosyltransferase family 2 protein [Herbaspirillum sp. VT-16-41]|uniref:glycosyltransferase family 2 protein n=1 Tax=Herbaspirillum sp. VT-16-41 TaxID=1953765 RepID=UPI0009822B74|nr:glycosyltransferase family 2 protein [Herbaspirillum sp. VT-16-41]ONN67087.1 glycosyl transferase [Herbaspirillum sp. VT-16-41]